jgi:phosphoserine phosphatase
MKKGTGGSGYGAAFFDIDGTLLAKPSLERRFLRELDRQGKIPAANYFRWLLEFVRAAPRDISQAAHGNKAYLRCLPAEIVSAPGAGQRLGYASGRFPEFFPAAIERVWRHALQGDAIVLASGTLAPLAEMVKFALERELLWRGVDAGISVIATQLEISNEQCTGRVANAPTFGRTKAFAVKGFARERGIELKHSSAYGDSSLDRWMLASVGHPLR